MQCLRIVSNEAEVDELFDPMLGLGASSVMVCSTWIRGLTWHHSYAKTEDMACRTLDRSDYTGENLARDGLLSYHELFWPRRHTCNT